MAYFSGPFFEHLAQEKDSFSWAKCSKPGYTPNKGQQKSSMGLSQNNEEFGEKDHPWFNYQEVFWWQGARRDEGED